MKSLIDLGKEVKSTEDSIEEEKLSIANLYDEIKRHVLLREELERDFYQKKILLSHIIEIFRLAKAQFSRLRNLPGQTLSDVDVKELDKWIGRVKSEDGLLDIRNAVLELDKYHPSDIKTNLYALVQKIIIEGPYKKQRK